MSLLAFIRTSLAGSPPAIPLELTATAISGTEIVLIWDTEPDVPTNLQASAISETEIDTSWE